MHASWPGSEKERKVKIRPFALAFDDADSAATPAGHVLDIGTSVFFASSSSWPCPCPRLPTSVHVGFCFFCIASARPQHAKHSTRAFWPWPHPTSFNFALLNLAIFASPRLASPCPSRPSYDLTCLPKRHTLKNNQLRGVSIQSGYDAVPVTLCRCLRQPPEAD